MRCHCCNLDLGPLATMDRPTTRYYCTLCFEPTLQVQLAAASEDIEWARVQSSETLYSYHGIAEILEVEGWESVKDVISIEDYEEEFNPEQDNLEE